MKTIKIKKLNKHAKIDSPAKAGDCGFDVYSTENIVLGPGERLNLGLGIAAEIEEGYMGMICAKSGRARDEGLTTIGNIIDSGYRGEIHANLLNTTCTETILIKQGEKVAQIIFFPVSTPKLQIVDELSKTDRGTDGFGSTGK